MSGGGVRRVPGAPWRGAGTRSRSWRTAKAVHVTGRVTAAVTRTPTMTGARTPAWYAAKKLPVACSTMLRTRGRSGRANCTTSRNTPAVSAASGSARAGTRDAPARVHVSDQERRRAARGPRPGAAAAGAEAKQEERERAEGDQHQVGLVVQVRVLDLVVPDALVPHTGEDGPGEREYRGRHHQPGQSGQSDDADRGTRRRAPAPPQDGERRGGEAGLRAPARRRHRGPVVGAWDELPPCSAFRSGRLRRFPGEDAGRARHGSPAGVAAPVVPLLADPGGRLRIMIGRFVCHHVYAVSRRCRLG